MCYDFIMQDDSQETGRVFRTAALLWVGYLVSLFVMDTFIYAGRGMQPVFRYYLINCVPALFFLVLSFTSLVRKQINFVAPLMVSIISVVPIFLNYELDLRLPEAPLANLEGMIMRQLPVLIVGLALVAWYYKLSIVLIYCLGIFVIELAIVESRIAFGERQIVLLFVLTIRTITMAVLGIFINRLIARLRSQQEILKSANNELAHYASTLERLAVSQERNRLARELHDTLAHTLSGLSVQLEATKAYWDVEPETALRLLVQSLESTRSGLDETRRALKALRASPLEDLGLLLSLKKLAEAAAERGRLQLELILPEQSSSLSPDVEQCIYRVAQEALENVIMHAHAKKLSVKLSVQQSEVSLVIQDDGQGIGHKQPEQPGHFGLAGMRERAALAGGTLGVTSQRNQGTCIHLLFKGYYHDQSDHL